MKAIGIEERKKEGLEKRSELGEKIMTRGGDRKRNIMSLSTYSLIRLSLYAASFSPF